MTGRVLRWALVVAAALLALAPFAWLVSAAFKTRDALNLYPFLPPVGEWGSQLTLGNFGELLRPREAPAGVVYFHRHLLNSLFLASAQTVVSLVFSSMGGWALAKYRFRGRGAVLGFMLASMTVPGVTLLAPLYEIVYGLGWLDTYWALLVPGSVSVFGVFLFRQALSAVPDELLEAGRIDGASELRLYWRLAMPLVRPASGAYCLVAFLGAWNSFLAPGVFLQTRAKLPLPVILNQYVGEYTQQYGVFLAGTLLAIVPPAVLFLLLQREFIGNLTAGGVKQ